MEATRCNGMWFAVLWVPNETTIARPLTSNISHTLYALYAFYNLYNLTHILHAPHYLRLFIFLA